MRVTLTMSNQIRGPELTAGLCITHNTFNLWFLIRIFTNHLNSFLANIYLKSCQPAPTFLIIFTTLLWPFSSKTSWSWCSEHRWRRWSPSTPPKMHSPIPLFGFFIIPLAYLWVNNRLSVSSGLRRSSSFAFFLIRRCCTISEDPYCITVKTLKNLAMAGKCCILNDGKSC